MILIDLYIKRHIFGFISIILYTLHTYITYSWPKLSPANIWLRLKNHFLWCLDFSHWINCMKIWDWYLFPLAPALSVFSFHWSQIKMRQDAIKYANNCMNEHHLRDVTAAETKLLAHRQHGHHRIAHSSADVWHPNRILNFNTLFFTAWSGYKWNVWKLRTFYLPIFKKSHVNMFLHFCFLACVLLKNLLIFGGVIKIYFNGTWFLWALCILML